VIDGVTISLKAASGSTDLSLDYDTSAAQAKVQSLLDSFNDVVRTIDGQTLAKKNSDGSLSAGAFSGDTIPRVIRTSLTNALASKISGARSRLADVGITTQRDGTLSLDSAKFQTALTSDPASVARLFGGTSSTDGIADLLWSRLDTATKTLTGTIAVRQDGITSTIKSLDSQIDQGQERLSKSETTLRAQFSHLEQLVSQTQRTGNAMLSALQSLSDSQKNSNR